MGTVVGFVLLTLVSYLLIVINFPILIVPVIIILLALIFKPLVYEIKQIKIKFNLQTVIILIVFILGIVGQLAVISPSGVFQNGDLVFWSAHGHDGAWHIALMEEIKKGYPFGNPSLAGEKLVNYHFFSDILPAIAFNCRHALTESDGASAENLFCSLRRFFSDTVIGNLLAWAVLHWNSRAGKR